MILVSGAAGKTGQAVIRALVARGTPVRAFVYRETQKAVVSKLGAAETVAGDMQDADVYQQAAEGVQAIYHICPNMHPAEVAIGKAAIKAAQAAGVERFVYHSVLHPGIEWMPHHWHKLRVEEMLLASGLAVTILQPTAYMQNIPGNLDGDTYRVPYPLETRLSLVDLNDVGEAAAIVLMGEGHAHATYPLCSTDAPTQAQIAALLSSAWGRPITAEAISIKAWEQQALQGGALSRYAVDTLAAMFQYYGRHGMRGNPNVLRWLLGREPISIKKFVEQIARTLQE